MRDLKASDGRDHVCDLSNFNVATHKYDHISQAISLRHTSEPFVAILSESQVTLIPGSINIYEIEAHAQRHHPHLVVFGQNSDQSLKLFTQLKARAGCKVSFLPPLVEPEHALSIYYAAGQYYFQTKSPWRSLTPTGKDIGQFQECLAIRLSTSDLLPSRTAEPQELMLDDEQVSAYSQADFTISDQAFFDRLMQSLPKTKLNKVLDLGCGNGAIAKQIAADPGSTSVTAVDGSKAMLEQAQTNLDSRIQSKLKFIRAFIPDGLTSLAPPYDTIVSNSLLHHLNDPLDLWHSIRAMGRPGTRVHVMDLIRPPSKVTAQNLVEKYANSSSPVLKRDFYNSFLASYRVEEVLAQLILCDLPFSVEQCSDRHLLISGVIPATQ